MAEENFSEDDYTKILQEKLNTCNFVFTYAEWKPFSENAVGFIGQHNILKLNFKINENEESATFFVKTKPKSEVLDQLVRHVYEKEIFFYKFITKEFEKLVYHVNFYPKLYYTKNSDALILENLKEKNFNPVDMTESFNKEQCMASLKALAQLHASSMVLEETKSVEIGRTYEIIEENRDVFKEVLFSRDESSTSFQFFKAGLFTLLHMAKLIPESEEFKELFVQKLTEFDPVKYFEEKLPFRKTICHSDLWSNNILFQYSKDIVNCALVDFQVIRYFYPSFDVNLLLFLNTTRDFRKKHFDFLTRYYYETFEEVLRKNGLSVCELFPEEEFFKSLIYLKPLAVFQGSCYKTVRYLGQDDLNSVEKSDKNLSEVFLEDDRRIKFIENMYKNDEDFRKAVADDIYDLYDVL